MIIGQFCDTYPPELDGVGTVVKNYTIELTNETDQCFYISAKNKNYPASQTFPTILYNGFKFPGEAYYIGFSQLDKSYRKTVKRISFDIVHAHSPFMAGSAARRIAKRQNIPLVGTFHSKFYDDFLQVTHSKLIAKACVKYVVNFYNHCDEVWAVNHATAKVLKEYGYKGTISVMPNGTNPANPTDIDRQYAQETLSLGNGPVLLFVGQQHWKKNIKKIIQAIEIYVRENDNKDIKMVMVGQGSSLDKIKEYIHQLNLDQYFLFTGHIIDKPLLLGLFARADLFVFPSLYDNAPMVVREAASAGTPSLLIKDSCSAEGVEDGVNGFLCENTPESIAKTIQRALPIAKTVGEKARETIPLPWKKVVSEARARYAKAIEHKKTKS